MPGRVFPTLLANLAAGTDVGPRDLVSGTDVSGVGVAMSMRSYGPGEVPVETARVARAAFPRGSLAIRVRDGCSSRVVSRLGVGRC